MNLPDTITPALPYVFILLGLLFGSFVSAVSYRLPRGENIVSSRSRCPSCRHTLGVADLFPVLSWLSSNRACRYCRFPISIRYPLTEIAAATTFWLVYYVTGLTPLCAVLIGVTICLLILIVIDLEHYIIPDTMQIALAILGIAYTYVTDKDWFTTGGTAIGGLIIGITLYYIMILWKKQEGLGLGDVKFLGVVGLFLIPTQLPMFFFLSGILGIFTALIWRALGQGERFPFGPALAMALYLHLLFPQWLTLGQ